MQCLALPREEVLSLKAPPNCRQALDFLDPGFRVGPAQGEQPLLPLPRQNVQEPL